MTFGSAWVEPMDIKSLNLKGSAVGQAEALKEPKQHWEHTVDPAEV
jgi:hypothetical protein